MDHYFGALSLIIGLNCADILYIAQPVSRREIEIPISTEYPLTCDESDRCLFILSVALVLELNFLFYIKPKYLPYGDKLNQVFHM